MRAREAAMERSLFERLQVGGCPVSVLSVQYRMHPAIRAFPSAHFYGGAPSRWVRPAPCKLPTARQHHMPFMQTKGFLQNFFQGCWTL